MTLRAPLLAAVLLLTALAGCSGSDSDPTTTGTETTVTSSSSAGTTSTVTQTQTQTTTRSVTTTVTGSPSSSSTPTPTGPPSSPPVITEVAVSVPTSSGATVSWNVSDDQEAVQSRVEYSPDPPANFGTRSSTQLGTGAKGQALTDLASCTTYRFRVLAVDPSGNSVTSTPMDFTTNRVALGISSVSVSAVTHNAFTVAWTVTGPADAKSHVEFGLTTALDGRTPDITGNGAKSVRLSGLEPNRDYHYRIFVNSPCDDTATLDATQKTGVLLEVSIEGNGGSINSFDPGSTLYGPMAVPKDRPITFKIVNNDSVPHSWEIVGRAHASPTIAAGATHTFSASISLAAGTHTMRCTIHDGSSGPAMTGTIEAS